MNVAHTRSSQHVSSFHTFMASVRDAQCADLRIWRQQGRVENDYKDESAKASKQRTGALDNNPVTTYSMHIKGGIMGISLES